MTQKKHIIWCGLMGCDHAHITVVMRDLFWGQGAGDPRANLSCTGPNHPTPDGSQQAEQQ